MLEPENRVLLFETLRPPSGYSLDAAVGTTFSLDLLALLVAPLSFTVFQWQDREGRPASDPLALLEALRRHAGRISLFCQAGQIAVPSKRERLFAYLEGSVHEVRAPDPAGVFHPKVWALRFTREGAPVRYRVLVLSRNLTFDASWDTAVALDGEVLDRANAIRANHPLGDFLRSLPAMAIHGVPADTRARVDLMQEEIRKVRFEVPEGFEEVRFWPIGHDGRESWPFPDSSRRMLVISPFLTESLLEDLSEDRPGCVLVSRPESLEEISAEVRGRFETCHVLAQEVDPAPEDATPTPEGETAMQAEEDNFPPPTRLTGLHAKAFVEDDGWNASIWTGSANATEAAFRHNVEFLVELRGKKSRCGIDAILGREEGVTGLGDLLQPFVPPEAPVVPDAVQRELDRRLEEARKALAGAGLRTRADVDGETSAWSLHVLGPAALPEALRGAEVTCRPVTLREHAAVPVAARDGAWSTFTGLSEEALTAFLAFEVTVTHEGRTASARFVLRLQLEGTAADRMDRLLRLLLRDRRQVERFLMMLLAGEDEDLAHLVDAVQEEEAPGAAGDGTVGMGLPLLEALLRALHRRPEKLEAVERFVADLGRIEEGRRLLPEGLDRIWPAIVEARGTLRP